MDRIIRTLGSTIHSNKQRADWDFYATDPQCVNDLLSKAPQLGQKGLEVLEPCAGIGTLADRYTELTDNIVDMYDICARREDIGESNYMDLNCKDQYDLILTNFPYAEATRANPIGFTQLLLKALSDVKPGGYVCSFQRLLQLESKKRFENIYCKRKPETIYVYSHRVACYENGDFSKKVSSAVAYCWVIWHKDENGFFSKETKLDWIY